MQQKHTKRSTDTKRKPVKVVYISNPMKFVATPDEFRAVVQQLTGWQSNIVDVAEATGFLTAGRIADGSTNMETNSIDQTCRLACGPDFSASLEGHLYEGGVHARTTLTGVTIGVDVTATEKIWRTFQSLGDIAFAYSYSNVLIEIQLANAQLEKGWHEGKKRKQRGDRLDHIRCVLHYRSAIIKSEGECVEVEGSGGEITI
ncbi:Amino acid permease 6 [Carex littledalei]|uniref:Amino acid permease 6 n=1 Tax=Carex littledalei TaxID=544730 RepID=A0A833VFL4_9POAL|nr:Amino acid permease 6 [Carex littledalei]